jgi:hypothetical protein
LPAVRLELLEELIPPQESQAVRRLAAPVAEAERIAPLSLAWPEPMADSLVVAAVVGLPLTTASRLVLAVLAVLELSTSSPIANP